MALTGGSSLSLPAARKAVSGPTLKVVLSTRAICRSRKHGRQVAIAIDEEVTYHRDSRLSEGERQGLRNGATALRIQDLNSTGDFDVLYLEVIVAYQPPTCYDPLVGREVLNFLDGSLEKDLLRAEERGDKEGIRGIRAKINNVQNHLRQCCFHLWKARTWGLKTEKLKLPPLADRLQKRLPVQIH